MPKYYKNINAYIKAINSTIKDVPKYLTEKLNKHADGLVSEVKSRTPVDTGNLRDSWKRSSVEKSGKTYKVRVTNDAQNPEYGMEYATYVEYGHRTTAGNWFEGYHMLLISEENTRKRLADDLNKDQVDLYSELI